VILSVTFANGSAPSEWAVTSDLGGTAEVSSYCPAYGGPYCTYPWYAANSAYSAIIFGADYPGTKFDYKQGSQFPATMQCGGPYGPDSTYCDAVLKPSPLSWLKRAALQGHAGTAAPTGSPAADSSPGPDHCHGVAAAPAVPTGAMEGSAVRRRHAP
jgi:hypothetical protein